MEVKDERQEGSLDVSPVVGKAELVDEVAEPEQTIADQYWRRRERW